MTGVQTCALPISPVAAQPIPQDIAFPILFEDDDLIVLDKPRGYIADPYPSLDSPERFRAWFEEEGCIVVRNAVAPRLCQAGIDAFRNAREALNEAESK